MSSNKYQKDLDKLEAWAINRGYTVHFIPYVMDAVWGFDKSININSKCKLETQLYSLLHECGHIMVRSNQKKFRSNYPISHTQEKRKSVNKQIFRTKSYQVDIITEEIDAWRKGKELAKRIGIKLSNSAYDKETSKWVFSYINTAYENVNSRKRSRKKPK